MAKRLNNQSTVGDVLKEIIQVNRLQSGIDQIEVQDCWKNSMGKGVNTYTRNVVFKNGVLYVELTSSVLREELTHGKSKIVKMLNEELGREIVTGVVLR